MNFKNFKTLLQVVSAYLAILRCIKIALKTAALFHLCFPTSLMDTRVSFLEVAGGMKLTTHFYQYWS
jgi:hypothetical protein